MATNKSEPKKKKRPVAAPLSAQTDVPTPAGAAFWMVRKQVAGRWERCSRHEAGRAVDCWPMTTPPSTAALASVWGRGTYRLVFLTAARKSAGTSPEVRLDDPSLPDRGVYPEDPMLRARDEAPPPPTPAASMMMGLSPDASVPLPVFAYCWNLAQLQADAQVRRVEAQAALEIARIEAQSKAAIADREAFFKATTAATLAVSGRGPDPEKERLLRELTKLREKLEEDDEDDDSSALTLHTGDPNVAALMGMAKEHGPSLFKAAAEWLANRKESK